MGDEYTTSPGQLRQFENSNGWLPSQTTTETIGTTTVPSTEPTGGALALEREVKPMTFGQYAQKVSFNKGDYFSHDNKVYYKAPDGKVSLVTGAPEGDVELDAGQTAQLEKERGIGPLPSSVVAPDFPMEKNIHQEAKNRCEPILHFGEHYDRAKALRSWGHNQFNGEVNSDVRHSTVSYKLAHEYGPDWSRIAGIGNELQGLVLHDVPDLPGRIMGERPWAFSLQDLRANEVGIQRAEKEIESQIKP